MLWLRSTWLGRNRQKVDAVWRQSRASIIFYFFLKKKNEKKKGLHCIRYNTALKDIDDAVLKCKRQDIPLFLMGHSMVNRIEKKAPPIYLTDNI